MITKQQFKKLIQAIQKYDKKIEKIEKFIESCGCDSWVIFEKEFSNDVIEFLQDYFNHGSDDISWWLYEDIEKHIWENGLDKPYTDVTKIGDFYDYLARCKKENEQK